MVPLVHLTRQPQAEVKGAPPLLILLHGIGSNEHDLFALAPMLDPRFLILSARAPYSIGPSSYAWFEIVFRPEGILINQQQALGSRALLLQFIEEACGFYGANPRQIYLAGFSQGGIMSVAAAFKRPDLLAGAAIMSGRVPPELEVDMVPAEQLRDLPMLLVNGINDEVLSIDYARQSKKLLETLGVNLTYREHPIGHWVSEESLADVRDWLREQLDRYYR